MDDTMSAFLAGKMDNGGNNCCVPMVPAYGYGYGMGYGGFGMGGMWGDWIPFVLILALLGGNGFGFGGFGGGAGLQGIATRADINEGFALNNITSGITAIQQGICDSTYALNNTLTNGFHGVDNAICTLGYQTQQGFNGIANQLAQCCCDTRASIQGVNTGIERTGWSISKQISDCCCDLEKMDLNNKFAAQTYNCNTLQAIDKLGDRILGYLTNKEAQDLRDELQTYRLAASQANQNNVLMAAMDANKAEILRRTGSECPSAAYIVNPPTPVTFRQGNCCGGCGNGYTQGFAA